MCHENGKPKVEDLMLKLLETDICNARYWVAEFQKSIISDRFFVERLTSERARFIMDDMAMIISRSLSLLAKMNFRYYLETLWQGHIFLQELRQKAVALGADVDLVKL